MERCSSLLFFVPSPNPVANVTAGAQSIRFRRILSLVGIILISTQFSIVIALDSPSPSPKTTTIKLDVSINIHKSPRSVVDVAVINSTSTELGASSSNNILDHRDEDVEAKFHHRHNHRRRFQASSYVEESLKRSQQQHQQNEPKRQKQRHKHKKSVKNLRKLASQFGCLDDPSVCLTVPGWTTESYASTCCSSGLCTDTQFDNLNCGACGNECTFGFFCCSGTCVALSADPKHCGSCNNVCSGGGICEFGFCGYSTVEFVVNATELR
ncbi:unnamed protein product [Calypogeia fissa]